MTTSQHTAPPRVDAIVALGCALHRGRPSPALERRLQLAARAYSAGVAPRVLVCGGRAWDGIVEADAMRDHLAAVLPEAEIWLERHSLNTAENALHAARLLRAEGLGRVLLATCRWHLPRALRNFAASGLEPVAPPDAWLAGPSASVGRRLRELVSGWADARLLATRRHMR